MGFRFHGLAAAVALLATAMSVDATANFTRLNCNGGLASAGCQSWTSFAPSTSSKVTIPCGQCVTMNAPGPELTLNGGLDIQGKLVFPDGYKIHVKTPFVVVQGELHMTSNKPVDGREDVKITLVGTNNNKFRPVDNNANNCNGGDCTIGIKPFIVAGGQLFVNGLPSNTPTWTKLHDITSTATGPAVVPSYAKYQQPITSGGCPGDGVFVKEDFTDLNAILNNQKYHVEGTLGTHFQYTGNSLKVFNRSSRRHLPSFDLMSVRGCLQAGVEYILTARIKITDSAAPTADKPTPCASNSDDCMHIRYQYVEPDAENNRYREHWLFREQATHGQRNGQVFTISETVTFNSDHLDINHVYEALVIGGIPANYDIEVFDFNFRLPPPETFKTDTNVCSDLAPANGDAELDPFSAYPLREPAGHTNLVVSQDGNSQNPTNFFRITGRSGHETWVGDTITWNVPVGCMQAHSAYDISYDVRVNGPASKVEARMVIYRDGGRIWINMGTCTVQSGSWVGCSTTYTVPETLLNGSEEKIEFYFDTPGAATVDIDFDNLRFAASGGPTNTLVVSNEVQGKWVVGAEVLVTSHTRDWDDDQVRRIIGVADGPSGFTKLTLDSAVRRPSTVLDSPLYASEVALLSRNIVIEGFKESGNQELIGAHIMVLHTPKIVQTLEGVEVRNGGQQGTLARYPIHFHFCHDTPGSVVRKNLIRESNQRCVVIHATDEVLVERNIAYDTSGHCFMTEDGMERFNKFHYNLGARTKAVSKIIPDNGSNGEETDNMPATFWMVNPTNDYVGNVAAGSFFSGFWLELRSSVRGSAKDQFDFNPRKMSLGNFRDNIAHSNRDKGFRTYPNGYVPDEKASFINSVSFRNGNHGLFFHNSRNLGVVGGHFADNRIGLDFDRVDYVSLENANIIGESPDFKKVRATQDEGKICSSSSGKLTGIELHSFAAGTWNHGLQADIEGVHLEGFDPVSSECAKAVAINLDDEVRWKTADYFTMFSGTTIDNSPRFDFCEPASDGITDFYVVDSGSGLRPAGMSPASVGTAMSNNADLLNMIPSSSSKCEIDAARCAAYCKDTCLRTVSYFVDPTAGNYTLKTCYKNNPSQCIEDDGDFYYDERDSELDDNLRNYDHNRFRIYAAHLPAGTFETKFVDDNGNTAWPVTVREQYEVDMCQGGAFGDGAVELVKPAADEAQCSSLIRNGAASASSTYPKYWRHHNGGVKVYPGVGIDGSNALGSMARRSTWDSISQFIDTRCMSWAVGKIYEIKAYVKVTNADNQYFFCDPSKTTCPSVAIGYNDASNAYKEIRDVAIIRSTVLRSDGYHLLQGYFTVPAEVAASNLVDIQFKRNRSDKWMYIDNASMRLVTDTSKFDCADGSNLVINGNFNAGNTYHWKDHNAEGLEIVSPGFGGSGHALKMTTGSAKQNIKVDCLDANERYEVSAKFRLLNSNGNDVACNLFTNNPRCPEIHLRFRTGPDAYLYNAFYGLGPQVAGEWNKIQSYITLDQARGDTDQVRLSFERIPSGHSLIVDDVSVKMIPQMCSGNVAPFANMDMGAARIWRNFGSTTVRDTSPGYGGSGLAILVTGRSKTWHGAWMDFSQYGDNRCFSAKGQAWEVSARVKLLTANTDTGAMCDVSVQGGNERCPKIWVKLMADGSDSSLFEQTLPGVFPGSWNADDFNLIKGTFTVPSSGFTDMTRVQFGVMDGKLGVDFVIDNFSARAI